MALIQPGTVNFTLPDRDAIIEDAAYRSLVAEVQQTLVQAVIGRIFQFGDDKARRRLASLVYAWNPLRVIELPPDLQHLQLRQDRDYLYTLTRQQVAERLAKGALACAFEPQYHPALDLVPNEMLQLASGQAQLFKAMFPDVPLITEIRFGVTADGRNTQIYLPNGRRTTGHVVEDDADGTVATGDGTVINDPNGSTTVGVRYTLLTDAVGHVNIYTPFTASKQPGNYLLNGIGDMVQTGLSNLCCVPVHQGDKGRPESDDPSSITAHHTGTASGAGDPASLQQHYTTNDVGCACRNEDPSMPTLGKYQIAPSLGMVSDGNGGSFADFPVGMEFQARGSVGTSGRGGALGGHGYISSGPSAGRRTVRDPGGGRLRLTAEFGIDAAKLEATLAGLTRLAENLARIASQFAKMGMRIEEIEILPGGVVVVRSSSPIVLRPSNLVVPGTESDVPSLRRRQQEEALAKGLADALQERAKKDPKAYDNKHRHADGSLSIASMLGMLQDIVASLRKLQEEYDRLKKFKEDPNSKGPCPAPQPKAAGGGRGKLPPHVVLQLGWKYLSDAITKYLAEQSRLGNPTDAIHKLRDQFQKDYIALDAKFPRCGGNVRYTMTRIGDEVVVEVANQLDDGTFKFVEELRFTYEGEWLRVFPGMKNGQSHSGVVRPFPALE